MQMKFESATLRGSAILLIPPQLSGLERTASETQVAQNSVAVARTIPGAANTLVAARAAVLRAETWETTVWGVLAVCSIMALVLSLWL